ncbi:DUF1275 family protein [Salinisphaera sp. SPP-AMP-43]|uniref:YoaK family protein n=1 Tax=Salinisphaera sp. SPP-AMP-43 TaxID=3121288 RepID=UPI003C6E02B4
MMTHRRRERALAVLLTGLAGYVDALGFMKLGGYFIAFMSGNTTRLGAGLVQGIATAVIPAVVIALFVLGVVFGSLINHFVGRHRRTLVLALVTVLLVLGGLWQMVGLGGGAVVCLALAMGVENTVFERNGEVSLGVTYMTGTLVKLGQRLTDLITGRDRWAWLWYLLLWAGLLCGTILGSAAYLQFGLASLWWAAATAAVLTAVVARWVQAPTPAAMRAGARYAQTVDN